MTDTDWKADLVCANEAIDHRNSMLSRSCSELEQLKAELEALKSANPIRNVTRDEDAILRRALLKSGRMVGAK